MYSLKSIGPKSDYRFDWFLQRAFHIEINRDVLRKVCIDRESQPKRFMLANESIDERIRRTSACTNDLACYHATFITAAMNYVYRCVCVCTVYVFVCV